MPAEVAHLMRSKFESVCPMCGRPISVGQLVLKMVDGGVRCRSCRDVEVAFERSSAP